MIGLKAVTKDNPNVTVQIKIAINYNVALSLNDKIFILIRQHIISPIIILDG